MVGHVTITAFTEAATPELYGDFKWGHISGNFNIESRAIERLDGLPQSIGGTLKVRRMRLITLAIAEWLIHNRTGLDVMANSPNKFVDYLNHYVKTGDYLTLLQNLKQASTYNHLLRRLVLKPTAVEPDQALGSLEPMF